MAPSLLLFRKWRFCSLLPPPPPAVIPCRSFRSDAALEALAKASEAKSPNVLVLYNYPSFSGAFSALFAHLYHSRLNLPCLTLPFSSAIPFRVEDVCIEGLKECYFLDFLGPKGFALELFKKTSCKVIGFDHRKSVLAKTPASKENLNENLALHVNLEKSSSFAVYEYFSSKLSEIVSDDENSIGLIDPKDRERVELVLKYIEDGNLRRWSLPDSETFNVGIREWRSKLNCITNPHVYQQLMEMSAMDIIAGGNSSMSARQIAANKLLDKVFKVRLGRGLYGECLGVRLYASSDLIDEIGKELSRRSAAAGLRSIGAVVYMQRKNLKMCLRSMDVSTDTSEISKVPAPSSSGWMNITNGSHHTHPDHIKICTLKDLKDCYFLDFLGPESFALELFNETSCKVIGLDHLRLVFTNMSAPKEYLNENLVLHVNLGKSISISVCKYFSPKLSEIASDDVYSSCCLHARK